MTTKATTSITVAGILGIALGLAGLGFSRAQAVQRDLAAAQVQRSKGDSDIQQWRAKIAAARAERARQDALLKRPSIHQPGQAAASHPVLALVARNPRLTELYLKSFRANLFKRMSPYYQSAGLSPEQIGKFEDILVKREEGKVDLMATAAAQGLAETDPALATLRKQQADEEHAGETALLGDAGYQQWQQYSRSEGTLPVVGRAVFFSSDDEPFSIAQIGQVMQILANASPPYQQGGQFDVMNVNWNDALAQAAAILSPSQLSSLKTQSEFAALFKLQSKFFASPSGK